MFESTQRAKINYFNPTFKNGKDERAYASEIWPAVRSNFAYLSVICHLANILFITQNQFNDSIFIIILVLLVLQIGLILAHYIW